MAAAASNMLVLLVLLFPFHLTLFRRRDANFAVIALHSQASARWSAVVATSHCAGAAGGVATGFGCSSAAVRVMMI